MTLDEVNALVPELDAVFRRIEALREELAARSNEVERLGFGAAAQQSAPPVEIVQRRDIITGRVSEYQNEIRRIGELGGQLKDLDLGFVDFPSDLDGEPVLLSWQYGEDKVLRYRLPGSSLTDRKALPKSI